MSQYTKSTNFATKDNLSPGNPLKIVKGTEIDTEFNNIATAVATKTDNASAAITGGTITGITDLAVADGGTGASTAAGGLNNLLPSQTSNANKYLQTDGTNASWDAVSLSTADITGTLPVANGGTGVTTSTGTTNVVLSNSPTLVTPNLGTPSALVGTNITGTASGLTAGNVTTNANLTGGVTSVGNAATVVTNANLTGAVTSVGNATSLGSFTSANLLAALTDETGTGSAVFATSPTLVTPALGTPSALVGTNITGTASGLTAGNVTTNANLTGAITSTGNATSLGSFSSANLLGALTDETGTGSAVFATSPTLVTPILGTPTSATLTNATGLPLTTGVTGQLPVANGGTGTATPSIVAGTNVTVTGAWPNQTIAASGSSGTVTSVAATVPSLFSISGSPITTSGTLALTYSGTALPVVNGGTGQTTYTDGQLLIGNTTGNTLTKATLTAGSGVTITNGSGAITIAASGTSQWTTSGSDIYYSTGNVGIGTSTAPTARLSATNTATGASTALINVRAMQNDGTTLGTPIVLAGHRYLGSQDNNSGVIDVPSSTGRMALSVNGTVMAAYNTTQMGIGANSFGDLFHRLAVIALSDLGIEVNCGSATATPMTFRSGGGNRGTITTTAGGTAYNTTSDYRLKENIVNLPNALSTLAQLKPRQFSWKETGNTTTGFVAHELAEVCPHAVTGQKDAVDANENPQYQGIDTSFLIATLTAAIQEQQAMIASLKARLDAANL